MNVPDAPPPYATVVFDCDSTLATIEGIEELAVLAGTPDAELRRLTAQAMDGSLPLEAVYGRRLDLVDPSRELVARVGARYVETALPHARELVAALRSLGKRVVIVSGGVLPAVRILADHLGVEPADTHAVDLRFAPDGAYAGYDEASPLARAGGKPEVIAPLAARGPVVLVGDGATDLEAAPVCARFVAFGGVEARPAVFEHARVRCATPDLAALVPLLLAPEEIDTLRRDPAHAPLTEPQA